METKNLRRSVKDSVIGGVSGGLGEYFNTDPVIFRILFVVLTLTGGGGVFVYLLMWIFIPKSHREFENIPHYNQAQDKTNDSTASADTPEDNINTEDIKEPEHNSNKSSKIQGNIIGGSILIIAGSFFLADDFFPWFNWEYLWPIALIIAGLAIIKINYDNKKKK